jgi:hypothetical protein
MQSRTVEALRQQGQKATTWEYFTQIYEENFYMIYTQYYNKARTESKAPICLFISLSASLRKRIKGKGLP